MIDPVGLEGLEVPVYDDVTHLPERANVSPGYKAKADERDLLPDTPTKFRDDGIARAAQRMLTT